MKVSIVTFCKGRLSQLKQCLQSIAQQTYPHVEVIVVDYACPERTADCMAVNWPQFRCVKADAPSNEWNINKARNEGIRNATGDFVMVIDADTILEPDCIEENIRDFQADEIKTFRGNVLMHRRAFHALDGYNELHIHGYGFDDSEFYKRAEQDGYRRQLLTKMSCLNHSNEIRTTYQQTSIRISCYRNRMVKEHKGIK